MKLAVIGSRKIPAIELENYIPDGVDEIVSGGARGIDSLARDFALRRGIMLTEFLPEYKIYGRGAPLKRDEKIAEYADEAIAVWDGSSRGTKYTIERFRALGKRVRVITVENDGGGG